MKFQRDLAEYGFSDRQAGRQIVLVSPATYEAYLGSLKDADRKSLRTKFTPHPGNSILLKNRVVVCVTDLDTDPECRVVQIPTVFDNGYLLADTARDLMPGIYGLSQKSANLGFEQIQRLTLGWGLGNYRFTPYKTSPDERRVFLSLPNGTDDTALFTALEASYLAQDLINQPPNILGCDGLTDAAQTVANHFNAKTNVITGEQLETEYPLIHHVGKGAGAKNSPRLVDIRWGNNPGYPTIALVGKGVVFDTGGMNLKPDDQMRNMKIDMAGAAHALAVAYMAMKARLRVNLRVLLPIVRNVASPDAMQQGDVYKARCGLTVEIVHTDSEGRLILADAIRSAAVPNDPAVRAADYIFGYGTTGWHGYFEYPGFGAVYASHGSVQDQFLACARECQEYFAARPNLPSLLQELKKSGVADLLQASDDHLRYDDLLVFHFLMANLRGPERRNHVPPLLYCDLQPWREKDTPAHQFPEGLPPGAMAQGVRSSFALIKRLAEQTSPR